MRTIIVIIIAVAIPSSVHATAPSGNWQVLSGPEKEQGDPVQILDSSDGNLTLKVERRRGTVIRRLDHTLHSHRVADKLVGRYVAIAFEDDLKPREGWTKEAVVQRDRRAFVPLLESLGPAGTWLAQKLSPVEGYAIYRAP